MAVPAAVPGDAGGGQDHQEGEREGTGGPGAGDAEVAEATGVPGRPVGHPPRHEVGRQEPGDRPGAQTHGRAEHHVDDPDQQDNDAAVDGVAHQRAHDGADAEVDEGGHDRTGDGAAWIVDPGAQRERDERGGTGQGGQPESGGQPGGDQPAGG